MNKIITVYELLGLIKDGKAPKKIEWDNVDWEFKEEDDDYFHNGIYITTEGFSIFNSAKDFLDDKVKILEEYKPIIEKIEIEEDIVCNKFIKNKYGTKCYIKTHDKIIIEKLNQVIDYINKKETK